MSKTAKTQQHPNVEIAVKHFGPIAEASIDLRPLTVFVGPSNTGKTYFSTLVYTLHGIFGGFSGLSVQEPARFPLDRPEEIVRKLPVYLKDIEAAFKRCFDVTSVSDLIRSSGSDCNRLEVSLKLAGAAQEASFFVLQVQGTEITINKKLTTESTLSPHPQRNSEHCYYLPATRSGILQSHRVMASSLMERATRSNDSEVPTLSSVIVDFMKQLPLYEENKKPKDVILAIADALETEVLAGEIIMKPLPSGYPEFFYRPQGAKEEMRLNRASAMVSELAPLVLFLRGLIRPGDTLIIEEPEAHLHPGVQADMAVILARLVRAGVRIIVTTHSDWLLEEIGNLILEGELANLGGKTHEPPVFLQKEQVGAWLFQKNGTVEEIAYDRRDGIEPQEYGDVAEGLYNRSAELRNQIEDMKGTSVSE